MAGGDQPAQKGIKDVFYETRALMGRGYTLKRFAEEVLDRSVSPLMLGYIETGKRMPSEALVRRLAAVRKEDPQGLLALLWRDRMLAAFGKELRRVLKAPASLGGIEDADLAVVVSRAIAALPEDGSTLTRAQWRRAFKPEPRRAGERVTDFATLAAGVEQLLVERELIAVEGARIRRRGHHFVAQSVDEKQALALEYCALFSKGLLDKLALPHVETGTYLRNHYLHIAPERLPEFQRRLDQAITTLADEFAADPSARNRFLNVLVTSTPF